MVTRNIVRVDAIVVHSEEWCLTVLIPMAKDFLDPSGKETQP